MTRLKSVPLAIGLLGLSAGVALAFNPLPDQAGPGLERATGASERTVPVRPDALPDVVAVISATVVAAIDLTEAAAHGVAVSDVARAEDATPDTNHGADVSAVAKDHGQATASEHKPADAGPPAGVGKPDGAGQPEAPGIPDDPGAPDGAGAPEGVGRP
jgi:hypothetical protein